MGPGDRAAASVKTKRPCLQHVYRRLGAERRGVSTLSRRRLAPHHPITRRRNGQRQMQLQVSQTGGCDDVAYSSRLLGRRAVLECERKPEAHRVEPEVVERARLRNLRAMPEAVTSSVYEAAPAQGEILIIWKIVRYDHAFAVRGEQPAN